MKYSQIVSWKNQIVDDLIAKYKKHLLTMNLSTVQYDVVLSAYHAGIRDGMDQLYSTLTLQDVLPPTEFDV